MRPAFRLLPGRFVACFVAAALAISIVHGASLRDQLALADKADDKHSEIELIRRILDQEPADQALNKRLVHLWLDIEDYDMAEKALAAWKDAPANERTSVTAEILYYRDDADEKAVSVLGDYRKQDPNDLDITRQLAGYLTEMKQPKRVVALLADAPGVNRDVDLLVSRAIAKRALQDFDGALQDFALAEQVDSKASAITSNKPAFERLQVAMPNIKRATEMLQANPQDFVGLIARAYWYQTTGFAGDLAAIDAGLGLKENPNSATADILYAMAMNSSNQLKNFDAIRKYLVDVSKPMPPPNSLDSLLNLDLAIAKDPKDAKSLGQRAFVLNDAPAQYRLAVRDADAAIALDPKNISAYSEKIFALVKLGEGKDAMALLPAFEASDPPAGKLATVLSYLTESAFAASNFPQALDYISKAIKLNPTEAQYYRQRAAVYQRLNRPKDAQADLVKVPSLEKQ